MRKTAMLNNPFHRATNKVLHSSVGIWPNASPETRYAMCGGKSFAELLESRHTMSGGTERHGAHNDLRYTNTKPYDQLTSC